MDSNLIQSIKEKYKFSSKQINAVLTLLEEKNTVPFIARYRKEQTGGLDEVEIKQINDEYQYMVNLQKRKEEVIHNIEEQGLLTTELKNDILKQTKLQRVEDLYRPYKQKKKTRATEAKRKGLEPFTKWLKNPSLEMTIEEKATKYFNEEIENIKHYEKKLKNPSLEMTKEEKATQFFNEEIENIEQAIQGAQDIIAEKVSDEPKYRTKILKDTFQHGKIVTQKKKNAEDDQEIFSMYYDYSEPIKKIANHRTLAINRGEKEKILSVKIDMDIQGIENFIRKHEMIHHHEGSTIIENAIADSLKRLIMPSIEREIRGDLTEKAEKHAIDVFSENLRNLLLQPPMKGKQILGVDPAFRTGCKLAVINPFGTFIAKGVIYPHPPVNKKEDAEKTFVQFVNNYDVDLIAIGNGTASRETEQF